MCLELLLPPASPCNSLAFLPGNYCSTYRDHQEYEESDFSPEIRMATLVA